MSIKTYDPAYVHVVFGYILTGYAVDTAIKVTKDADTFEIVKGVGGVVSRKRNFSNSGIVEITLEQTSWSNDHLSAIAMADSQASSGILPLLVFDWTSKSVYVSAFAWVKRPADAVFGATLSPRVWQFVCPELHMFSGGRSGL